MIKGLNLLSILYYFVISQSTTLLQMPSNENLISQGNQIYGTTKCVLFLLEKFILFGYSMHELLLVRQTLIYKIFKYASIFINFHILNNHCKYCARLAASSYITLRRQMWSSCNEKHLD